MTATAPVAFFISIFLSPSQLLTSDCVALSGYRTVFNIYNYNKNLIGNLYLKERSKTNPLQSKRHCLQTNDKWSEDSTLIFKRIILYKLKIILL